MGRKEATVVWVLLTLMGVAGLAGYARVESCSLFAKQTALESQQASCTTNEQLVCAIAKQNSFNTVVSDGFAAVLARFLDNEQRDDRLWRAMEQLHRDGTKPVDLVEMARHYLYTQVRVETAAEEIGSGTLISGDVVLTAAHVVRACEDKDIFVAVFSEDGKVTKLPAHAMAVSDERDLAVLAVDTKTKLPHVKLATKAAAASIPVLSQVYAVGFPTGTGPYLTRGDLVNKREQHAIFNDCWFVSSPIISGNSGGALFDPATGELIGVPVVIRLTGGMTPVTHMGVVIPCHHVVEWLEEIKVNLD